MAERSDKPVQGAPSEPAGSPESQDRPQRTPHHTPGIQADKAARQERLAAEMRKNLQKRKRQQRARDGRKPGDG